MTWRRRQAPGEAPRRGARLLRAAARASSLWDLVQMECLARSRLAVQVVGEGGVGYLYFDRGHIVHATTAAAGGRGGGARDPGLDQRIVPAVRAPLARAGRRSPPRTRR